MIQLKNTTDKQTFHIPRTVMKTEFASGTEVKDVSITENGTYKIIPSKGKKSLSAVNLDVSVSFDADSIPFKVPADAKFAYSTFSSIPSNWDWSNFKDLKDCSQIFMDCHNLEEVPSIPFKNVTTLSQTFYWCGKLKNIDTSEWDTSNLKSLQRTFARTALVENPQIDTSKVTNFTSAFDSCEELRKVTNLDTSKGTSLHTIFYACPKLSSVDELDFSSSTSNFSSSSSPFYGCWGLRHFGGFKGLKVNMSLDECYSLSYESLMNIINNLESGVSNKTLQLTRELINILSDDDIAIATNKGWTITPTKSNKDPLVVTSLDDISYSTHRLDKSSYDFSQFNGDWGNSAYSNLPNVDNLCVFEGDITNTTDAALMFSGCTNLRYLDLTNTSNLTDTSYMLSGCENLTETNLKDWDVSNVTTMKGMFYDICDFDADFSNWDVSKVTDFDSMFYRAHFKTIDISNWKFAKSTRMKTMFSNSYTEHIILGDLSNVYMMDSIFTGCKALKSVTITGPISKSMSNYTMFAYVTTEGTFYYNPKYDYSSIIKQLPETWKAVPLE